MGLAGDANLMQPKIENVRIKIKRRHLNSKYFLKEQNIFTKLIVIQVIECHWAKNNEGSLT